MISGKLYKQQEVLMRFEPMFWENSLTTKTPLAFGPN